MLVELKHHFGWEQYEVPAQSLEEAAYLAVRQTHNFLTDANHSHEAGEHEITWGGKQLKFKSVTVYRGEGAPAALASSCLPDEYWFAVQFREPVLEAAGDVTSPGVAALA